MMQDFSMYCLDIAMNSVRANASEIKITLIDSEKEDCLSLCIEDNGNGMSDAQQRKVIDPFYTTRTTRKIGLGIAFFKSLADSCNGEFTLTSICNKGTLIKATAQKSHWDTPPVGNMPETVLTLIQTKDTIHWKFTFQSDLGLFILDTNEIKAILDDVSLTEPSILLWIKEYVTEQLENL